MHFESVVPTRASVLAYAEPLGLDGEGRWGDVGEGVHGRGCMASGRGARKGGAHSTRLTWSRSALLVVKG